MSRAEFEAAIADDRFLEWADFLGHLYGSPFPDPPPGNDVLLEIDLQGATQVLSRVPDAVLIWLTAPSRRVQTQRLKARGDSEESVDRRVEHGEAEERAAAELPRHVVVNDSLESALDEVRRIISSHRHPGVPRTPEGA